MRGYHDGQRAVQRRAGGAATAERLERGIRSEIPDVAQEFLAGVRLIFAASTDPDGHVWCSALSGPPGFVATPDDRTVAIAARPAAHDPLARALDAGSAPVGLLAIEPQTRRRMRVNGTAELDPDGVRVATEQVYSNCPKYIARRDVAGEAREPVARPLAVERAALGAADRRLLAAADTFFIATAADGSADASHRGGSPGFVAVHDERRLSFPDYAGNSMYMTLGNLAASPRAGLLVLDWETGDTLQISGRATIDWSPERAAAIPGAQRVVDVVVDRVLAVRGAIPLRWVLEERSRFSPPAAGMLARVPELGDPTSYLELEDGAPVFSADGDEIGEVEHVLADEDADIFDGLVIDTRIGPGGHRFADASQVRGLYSGGAVLTLTAAECEALPEPSDNPAVMDADPDDVTPDDLGDKLKRAWDLISGNY
jgi:predicted pyridoxine 5'-phosphate oxidase superfamily flavin-nucleotide-binding protein